MPNLWSGLLRYESRLIFRKLSGSTRAGYHSVTTISIGHFQGCTSLHFKARPNYDDLFCLTKMRLIWPPMWLTFSPWRLKILVWLTRFNYDLDSNSKSKVKTNISSYFSLLLSYKMLPNLIDKDSLPPNLYWLLYAIFSNNQIWWIAPCYKLHHLQYTNWQLKICMCWLYFSSWSPEGNLRIFLTLSPWDKIALLPCAV